MLKKIEEIVKLEETIKTNAMSFEAERESVIARYRNKAHEEIAQAYRDLEQEHEHNLEMSYERARMKRETLEIEKEKELQRLHEDYEKHFERVKQSIIEEVFEYGSR